MTTTIKQGEMQNELNTAFERGVSQGLTAWQKVLDRILTECKSMPDTAVIVIGVDLPDDGSDDAPRFVNQMRIPLGKLKRMG